MSTAAGRRLPLRPAVLALAGGGLLLAALVGLDQTLAAARRDHGEALQRFRAVDARSRHAADAAADRQREIAQFQRLTAAGRLAAEPRSAWIDKLAQLKAELGIAALRHELAPRRPLDGVHYGDPAGRRFEFMVSTMQLQMQLLHEGQLFALLQYLAETDTALAAVRRCSVERLAATTDTARLKADCLVDWITVRESGA